MQIRRAAIQKLVVLGVFCLLAWTPGHLGAAEAEPSSVILKDLMTFNEMGSVLFIAAHPDDENTQLIAYLARGRGYRTGYLSLTRGEGGQDLIGPEIGDELGVLRTQELLAARRIDGGVQFFSRAKDFGYSKDVQLTLAKWDHQEVLGDMVRIIRQFRPDVMIARFSPEPSATHGHHTASAVLATEAFKIAGDPKSFPEQLDKLTVWQPKRLLLNGFAANFGGAVPGSGTIRLDIGGFDPLLGRSFGEIAALSRSNHRTQGFGQVARRGQSIDSFQVLDGVAASKDIMDGVDTTWTRFDGGAEIGQLTAAAIKNFNAREPSASVSALLEIRTKLAALVADPVVAVKQKQLDRIIQACLGLYVETTIPQSEVVPGETLRLHHTAIVRCNVPVRWVGIQYPNGNELKVNRNLLANQLANLDSSPKLDPATPLTQPYWLRKDGTAGMYRVDDPALIGVAENPAAYPMEQMFEVGGQTIAIPDEPMQVYADPAKGEIRRKMDVIAPVSLAFVSEVGLFAPNSTKTVEVKATAFRANVAATIELNAPNGWLVTPASAPLKLGAVGDSAVCIFTITAPSKFEKTAIDAVATIDGAHYGSGREEIRYEHIPPQLLQSPARLTALCLDLSIRGKNVAYLPGAGDRTDLSLEQMGYAVTPISGADLTSERLKDFDAVVIGVRAFNVRTDLEAGMPELFAWVQSGGNVVEQYNRADLVAGAKLAPFEMQISRNLPNSRVTDEKAKVTFLAPDHPALNSPNKITDADFDGWIQERGLCFPSVWDQKNFTAILECSDVGEAPLKSGILVAHYGKGYFVYTGLSFFRQLPAGVPGAFRLFANLVSLGK